MHPATTAAPVSATPLKVGSIPSELKRIDRWILWKYVKKVVKGVDKWTKVPFDAETGHKVDATNTNNGTSFVAAVQALKKHPEFSGLGFILGEGIGGLDVDDCIDESGNMDERGQRMSQQYADTYAEVSPSGKGFKILVRIGDDPKLALIGKNTGDMEIYGGKRYFTITGHRLPGHAANVANLPALFNSTAEQLGAAREPAVAAIPASAKEALGIDMKAARELLDHLPFQWCDVYHDWLRAGMALHHEFEGDPEALELWDEWSQRNPEKYEPGACAGKWETFGKPGKDEVTMRTLVRDAQATGWRAPRTIARAISDFQPFNEQPEAGVDWWQAHSIGPMLVQPAPEKQWVWEGVLRAGKVLVLAGSGGSSKSYLMLGACVQYSLGNEWGPFKPAGDPGRVLLVYGEEDRDDVHDRVQALKHTFMLTEEHINTVHSRMAVLPLRGKNVSLATLDQQTQEVVITEQLIRLEQRIAQYAVRLVVLDPLALLHSLDENDNRAIAQFVSGLDALCMRQNCSIVIVHHFGKGGPVKAREINESNVRGASALAAHARTVVVMHRLREDEAQEWGVQEDDHFRWVMFAVAKNNYGPSGLRHWFNVDEHTGAITPAPAALIYRNASTLRQEVARARQEDAESEMTAAQERHAREQAMETVMMTNRIRILLKHAKQHGKIPGMSRCTDIILDAGMPCNGRRARAAVELSRNDGLIDTDGSITPAGERWLEDRAILE